MTPYEEQGARLRDSQWNAEADDGQSDAFMARYDRRILLHALDATRAERDAIAEDEQAAVEALQAPPPPHSCMAAEQEIERLTATLDAIESARNATYKVIEEC